MCGCKRGEHWEGILLVNTEHQHSARAPSVWLTVWLTVAPLWNTSLLTCLSFYMNHRSSHICLLHLSELCHSALPRLAASGAGCDTAASSYLQCSRTQLSPIMSNLADACDRSDLAPSLLSLRAPPLRRALRCTCSAARVGNDSGSKQDKQFIVIVFTFFPHTPALYTVQ